MRICTFAQPPTEGDCDGVLVWHVKEGNFGDLSLDGLNFAAVAWFKGNIWDEDTKANMGFLLDARAEERQQEGPTSVPGKRTQVHDPPGSEVGPGSVATYGTVTADEVDAFGFKWSRTGRSSKHMAFDWSGPD